MVGGSQGKIHASRKERRESMPVKIVLLGHKLSAALVTDRSYAAYSKVMFIPHGIVDY